MILESILKARQEQGYTIKQLSKVIGKSEATTYKYLYGEVKISLEDALTLCDFLGIQFNLTIEPKNHEKSDFLLAE
jgi:predicted transcriptional regulator